MSKGVTGFSSPDVATMAGDIQIILVLTAFLGLSAGQMAQECLSPYQQLGDLCFWVADESLPFNEAREYCGLIAGDGVGGDLLSASDCDSFSLLARHMELNHNNRTSYWVGAHRGFSLNEWFWLNEKSLSTGVPFFAHDEGTGKGEECGAIDGDKYWRLADFTCDMPQRFICGIVTNKVKTVRDDPIYPPLICPDDTVQVGEYCYEFRTTTASWDYAENYCREHYNSNNGMLFWPDTCEEFTRVAHHIAVDEETKGWWVGGRDVTGDHTWDWVNGESIPGGVPYWGTSYPKHSGSAGPNDQCAFMDDKMRHYMADTKCSERKHYVCKLHMRQQTLEVDNQ